MEYKNYYKNHVGYAKQDVNNNKSIFNYYKKNILKHIQKIQKNIGYNNISQLKVLEIGFGKGTFAKYCKSIGIKNYIGFDLDEDIVIENRNNIKDYIFENGDVLELLDKNIEAYDIIFMSHVFEHLTIIDANKYSEIIYKSLKKTLSMDKYYA